MPRGFSASFWPALNGRVVPNRTSSAGKVNFYYIREGMLQGFINIPETGNKRHGVQCSRTKVGGKFWKDKDVPEYKQKIYKKGSNQLLGEFKFVFGFFETSGKTKIYCWTNKDCLKKD